MTLMRQRDEMCSHAKARADLASVPCGKKLSETYFGNVTWAIPFCGNTEERAVRDAATRSRE